jgi:soluble lytic murein transglycosylase
VRRRWPWRSAVMLLLLAVAGFLGSRWAIMQLYPLDHRAILFYHAREQGLDPYLVAAVIRVESGFRRGVSSPQGARGLMQIMPETGEWAAQQMDLDFTPDMLFDPDYNIRMGSWYLAHLRHEFGGDTVLALAAYNAGRNNVQKWLDERQWTGEAHRLEQIPFKETRLYVAKVLRDVDRYRWIYTPKSHSRGKSLYAGTKLVRR